MRRSFFKMCWRMMATVEAIVMAYYGLHSLE
jgi:hypothetical protein